jgi:hypothetical protein
MIPQLELENIVRQGGHLCTIARSTCVMLKHTRFHGLQLHFETLTTISKKRFNTWKQIHIQIYPLVKLKEIQLTLLADNKDSLIFFFFIRFISSNLHVVQFWLIEAEYTCRREPSHTMHKAQSSYTLHSSLSGFSAQ